MARHVHLVQHLPFTEPGHLGWWAMRNSHTFTGTILEAGDSFPEPAHIDLVVLQGGPGPIEPADAPTWLEAERAFLTAALEQGAKILAIAQGAELMASFLGGASPPAKAPVAGWHQVERTDAGEDHPGMARLPSAFEAVCWTDRCLEPPEGATVLARQEVLGPVAFAYQETVLATSFQLGLGPSDLSLLARARPEPLQAGGAWIQDVGEMVEPPERFRQAHTRLVSLLDGWLGS